MLEQVKAYNAKHDGMPVKVAGAIIGAVIVGAAAFAVYNYSASTTVITMEPELIEEVVETTAKAAGGSKAA